jgi:ribosomal protein L40E
MNISFNSSPHLLEGLLLWIGLWTLVWMIVLATVLTRKDFDPVTRLTWALVVILVPFFGVVLYWVVAPRQPRETAKTARDYTSQPTTCITCGTAVPAGATQCPKCGWSYASG